MAWTERIQVIRPSEDENKRPETFEVDFERMKVHGDISKNVLLQEGDIIYVPPTILANVALMIEEVIRPVARAFQGAYYYDVSAGEREYYGGDRGYYR
jgi:hypothetical protein